MVSYGIRTDPSSNRITQRTSFKAQRKLHCQVNTPTLQEEYGSNSNRIYPPRGVDISMDPPCGPSTKRARCSRAIAIQVSRHPTERVNARAQRERRPTKTKLQHNPTTSECVEAELEPLSRVHKRALSTGQRGRQPILFYISPKSIGIA